MASQRAPLKVVTEFNINRDVYINPETTINLYKIPAEDTPEGAVLVPASGFENELIVGSGPIREQFVFKNLMYVSSGNSIYVIDTALAVNFLGTVSTSSGFMRMAANQTQIGFCDGVNLHVWDTGTLTYSLATLPSGVIPADLTVLDNYAIVPTSNGYNWYISALNDMTTWNSLDFAVFSSRGDQLHACATLKRRLYLFGGISTEVWYDAGAADFPFRRDDNALFEHGCISPRTIREGFEMLFYLANNEQGAAGVMMAQGVSNPQKISNDAVDIFLQTLSVADIQNADAILFKENGIITYQLNFTAQKKTLVYIVNTGTWHQFEKKDGSRHPANSHAFFNNIHFIGLYNTNQLFQQSYQFFTYGGDLIRCFCITPPLFDKNHKRIRIDRFELESITGIPQFRLPYDSSNAQLKELVQNNEAPEVILSVSRNGGRTYGNGRRAPMGTLGQYNQRILWRRLGVNRGRRIVFKLEFPYRVPFYIIAAYLAYEVLPQ